MVLFYPQNETHGVYTHEHVLSCDGGVGTPSKRHTFLTKPNLKSQFLSPQKRASSEINVLRNKPSNSTRTYFLFHQLKNARTTRNRGLFDNIWGGGGGAFSPFGPISAAGKEVRDNHSVLHLTVLLQLTTPC